jgi:hypothetical protein
MTQAARRRKRRSAAGGAGGRALALTLAAGAAGVAVLKRRRAAAVNEPRGQAFVGTGHEAEPDVPRSDGPPHAERAAMSGERSSESKGDLK